MNKPPVACAAGGLLVGLAGFEPTTSRPPDGRATRLRYSPMLFHRHTIFDAKNKGKTHLFQKYLSRSAINLLAQLFQQGLQSVLINLFNLFGVF